MRAPRPGLDSFISRPRSMRADPIRPRHFQQPSKLAFTSNDIHSDVLSAFQGPLFFPQVVFGTTHNGCRRCGLSPDRLSLSPLCRNNWRVVLSSVIPFISFLTNVMKSAAISYYVRSNTSHDSMPGTSSARTLLHGSLPPSRPSRSNSA